MEIVLEQMKKCLIAAGSSLAQVVKCNIYCVADTSRFDQFKEAYASYFPTGSLPASSCMFIRGRGLSISKSTVSPLPEAPDAG